MATKFETIVSGVVVSKSMEKEQQHMIPSAYLSAWADPNPRPGHLGKVWVVQKADTNQKAQKSPKKYFRQPERFTLATNGLRDISVENALGSVEAWFGHTMAKIKAQRPLDGHDRSKLALFTSAMMLRTERIPRAMANMLRTIQSQAAKQERKANIEPSYSLAIEGALPSICGDAVSGGLTTTGQMLIRMNVSIFIADDDAGFVTGDEPVSVIVPGEWHAYPTHPDVEITLPLSPRHIAYYSWKIPRLTYMPWDRYKVDRINSRTIGTCHKEFVSWKGIVRPEWFLNDFEAERANRAAS